MPNELSFIIRAIDKATGVMRGITSSASGMASSVIGSLTSILGVSVSVAGVFYGIKKAISESFRFETAETQFSVLLGSVDAAKSRIGDLKKFAAETPFEFNEIAQASRTLGVFSNNALGTERSLRLVGDAAAAVGQPFAEVANWVGRTYSAIKNGQPFGEAAQRLGEMGIMSGDTRLKLEQMQAAGASNIDIWHAFEKSLMASEGGMAKLAQTGDGLVSTLKDNLNAAIVQVGDTMQGPAKEALRDMIEWLDKLAKDGTLKTWATETVANILSVIDALPELKSSWEDSWAGKAASFYNDARALFKGAGAAMGGMFGGENGASATDTFRQTVYNSSPRLRALYDRIHGGENSLAKQYKSEQEQDAADKQKAALDQWHADSAASADLSAQGEMAAIGSNLVDADMKKTALANWQIASAKAAEAQYAQECAELENDRVQQSLNKQAREKRIREQIVKAEEDFAAAKRKEKADNLAGQAKKLNDEAALLMNGAPRQHAARLALVANQDAADADAKEWSKDEKRYWKLYDKEASGRKLNKSERKFLNQTGDLFIAQGKMKAADALLEAAAQATIDSKTTLKGIKENLDFLKENLKVN